MCVCACACVCTYMCVHVHVCTCTYVCVRVCMCDVCMCVCVCVCVCARMCVCVCKEGRGTAGSRQGMHKEETLFNAEETLPPNIVQQQEAWWSSIAMTTCMTGFPVCVPCTTGNTILRKQAKHFISKSNV